MTTPTPNSRRLLTLGLLLGGTLVFVLGGSFGYCEVIPSYDMCRVMPTCGAIRIEYVDGGHGPAWDCRSRWARW